MVVVIRRDKRKDIVEIKLYIYIKYVANELETARQMFGVD